jgi:hypothetical protein
MTPEELKPRMAELAGVLSAAGGELERLLPDLVGYPDLDVVRGVLRDVSRAAFNCTTIAEKGSGRSRPFAVSKGPELGGAIYALTTIGDPDRAGPCRRAARPTPEPASTMIPGPHRRTVGFFWTLEQAEEVLVNDYGDLDEEMYYPWAVIEEVCPGVYPDVRSQRYWEYDRQAERWKKADGCPASLQAHMRPDSRGVRFVRNWSEIG